MTLLGSRDASSPPTLLRIHGLRCGFAVANSVDITFQGLQFDMAREPYTYGELVRLGPDSMTIRFDAELYPFTETWLEQVQAVMLFDPQTWREAEDAIDIYGSYNGTFEAPNQYTIHDLGLSREGRFRLGQHLVVRHQVYGGNGLTFQNVSRVNVEQVTLWSMPGMGFYFGDSVDVTLRGAAVRRRPGRPMSITADASHFSQCRGTLLLDSVHFEGQGDDCVNIHGIFHDVRQRSSTTPGLFTVGSRPAGGISAVSVSVAGNVQWGL